MDGEASGYKESDDKNDDLDGFIVADVVKFEIIYQLSYFIIYFIFVIDFIIDYRPLYISHAFIGFALVESIKCTVVVFLTFMKLLDFQFKHLTTILVSGPNHC